MVPDLQGHLAHKKPPLTLGPPYGPGHMLLQVPRGRLLLVSGVPLYIVRVFAECQLFW